MQFIGPATTTIALAAFLSTAALAVSPNAEAQVHTQGQLTTYTVAEVAASRSPTTKRVGARLVELHAKLGITAEQEEQWDLVAGVMGDDANSIEETVETRHESYWTMNAISDLDLYALLAEAHAKGLRNLATEFGALYDTMSIGQKKIADGEFRIFERSVSSSGTATSESSGKRVSVISNSIR